RGFSAFFHGTEPRSKSPKRSPPRNNAKWMLRRAPHPLTNCYGGMPSHASDLYRTMNVRSAVQRGHK
ncbi:Major vault protein, partial [Dissostichus eleginoides]